MSGRVLTDAELALLLADSPWERLQREANADLDDELDRAFEALVLPEAAPASASQVRLRADLVAVPAAARRTR